MFDLWKLCFPFKSRKSSLDDQYTLLPQNSDTTAGWTDVHLGGDSIDLRPSCEIEERYVGFGIGGAGNMHKLVDFLFLLMVYVVIWLVILFLTSHVNICIGFSCEMDDLSEWLHK